ncbi:hypothetical protein FisN_25Hh063 [Fistulifera solaris]|jgi:hypothetical protein|uniref:Uncharacterized protein n=1 Tax=Fistulifera solaris TaxID=1519565 RepID=A0A1Z5JVL9_FISSO|nr:hypothetical protein FisN_25Hh063 [Fistulifera solaris]|eukprot:GAX18087.1 hypothetical protein FisN_25Hh063 [Fistulifera solaris]
MKFAFALAATVLTIGNVSAQAPIEAPEIVVFYLNMNAAADACSPVEFSYVDNKITPDLDMAMLDQNIEETQWTTSDGAPSRKLRGGEERELNATCDWCRPIHGRALCNSMFNCGFRRRLQGGTTLTEAQKAELADSLRTSCEENLAFAASRPTISATCAAGLAGAECFVQYV